MTDMPKLPDLTPDLGRAMAVGSLWMIAGRWMLRSIGLVSTIILARLLTPADFGLLAMAMLVIGALQVLAETGQRNALIRMRNPLRAHYDTAWTFGLLIGLVIALLLVVAGPVVAVQFNEPRLAAIFWALALKPLVQGFENVGLVDLQRSLNFRRDLQIMVWGKVGAFVVTIGVALWQRSYWALICGTLAQAGIVVGLSYVFSPYRPRLSLAKSRELWSFSIWSLAGNVALYASERADHAVVGVALDATAMGVYTVGAELASLPTEELVVPPIRALYAVYSRLTDDFAALREHYMRALSFIAIVASATSTGVALVAADAVEVVLGANWRAATPLIPWLALAAGVLGIARSVNGVLLAAGYAKANAYRALGFAGLLLPAAMYGVSHHGAEGAAIARFLVTLGFAPVMFWLLVRLLKMPPWALIAVLWRPAGAALAMTSAVLAIHPIMPPMPMLRLVLECAIGAATYAAALTLLWLAAGRPSGAEQTAWTIGKARWRLVSREHDQE